MQFTYPITVEPNTAADDPHREQIKLSVGTLMKISILFPWGCAGFVGIRIIHYEHQLYPTNRDEWLSGNEMLIEFDCEYEIKEGPGEFKIEAYNVDDFYEHTVDVSFVVLRGLEAAAPTTGWVEA